MAAIGARYTPTRRHNYRRRAKTIRLGLATGSDVWQRIDMTPEATAGNAARGGKLDDGPVGAGIGCGARTIREA